MSLTLTTKEKNHQYYIQHKDHLNILTETQKKSKREYIKKYAQLYPEKIIETRKKVRALNSFCSFLRKAERSLEKCIDCGKQEIVKGYCKKCYEKNRMKNLENIVKHRQSCLNYNRNHSDNIKSYAIKYSKEHRKQINAHLREYYKENPEKREARYVEYNKWKRNNPEKYRAVMKNAIDRLLDKLEQEGLEVTNSSYPFLRTLWRESVLRRFNNQCVICEKPAEIAHHLFFKSHYPKLIFNQNNGIALCRIHHNEVHGNKLGIKN